MVNLAINDSTFSSSGFSGLLFANPSFSIKEKIIRGVLHGEAGRTEIYKYRWNDLQVDTIEFIYHSNDTLWRFVKSRYFPSDNRNTQEQQIKLKSVPDEYKNLPELDWFMGNSEEKK